MSPECRRLDDLTALLFFLVGAERENLVLQGRSAREALEAASRLLGYDGPVLDEIRKLAA